MRTPRRHVLADGTVTYRVRYREGGRQTSKTFRGRDALEDATAFAAAEWAARGAQLSDLQQMRGSGRRSELLADCEKFTGVRPTSRDSGRHSADSNSRLPVAPLLRVLSLRGGLERAVSGLEDRDRVRLERALLRAKRSGALTVRAADDLAINLLRCHPSNVWGKDWAA